MKRVDRWVEDGARGLARRTSRRSVLGRLGLILAGALGNLYDRLHLHGWTDARGKPEYGVRDFLNCTIPGIEFVSPLRPRLRPEYHWPVFNLADVYLVTGAVLLTVYSFVSPQKDKKV